MRGPAHREYLVETTARCKRNKMCRLGLYKPLALALCFVGLRPRLLAFLGITLGLDRLLKRSAHRDTAFWRSPDAT